MCIRDSATDVHSVTVTGPGLSGLLFSGTRALGAGGLATVVLLFFLLRSGDLFLRRLVEMAARGRHDEAFGRRPRADKTAVIGLHRTGAEAQLQPFGLSLIHISPARRRRAIAAALAAA